MEGRGTPSHGLDLAAEYIAAQFRRAGLEPAGDGGYFQTTTLPIGGTDKAAKVRNVIGVLRGSDPILKNTYFLVTAHYDHLGMRTTPENDPNADTIYNGASADRSTPFMVKIGFSRFNAESASVSSRYRRRFPS